MSWSTLATVDRPLSIDIRHPLLLKANDRAPARGAADAELRRRRFDAAVLISIARQVNGTGSMALLAGGCGLEVTN